MFEDERNVGSVAINEVGYNAYFINRRGHHSTTYLLIDTSSPRAYEHMFEADDAAEVRAEVLAFLRPRHPGDTIQVDFDPDEMGEP